MQFPETAVEDETVPEALTIVQANNDDQSPPDSVSKLSEPSLGEMPSLSSPIGAKDLGLPVTPESRVLKPLDEGAMEEGYDSEGLRGPWEEGEVVDFDGPELQESPLPTGASPFLPVVPPQEFSVEKINTTENMHKMKVTDLKSELKKRGLSTNGKKRRINGKIKRCTFERNAFRHRNE